MKVEINCQSHHEVDVNVVNRNKATRGRQQRSFRRNFRNFAAYFDIVTNNHVIFRSPVGEVVTKKNAK